MPNKVQVPSTNKLNQVEPAPEKEGQTTAGPKCTREIICIAKRDQGGMHYAVDKLVVVGFLQRLSHLQNASQTKILGKTIRE